MAMGFNHFLTEMSIRSIKIMFLGGTSNLTTNHTESLEILSMNHTKQNFHTFVLHPACVNVSGYYNIRLRNTLLVICFYFPDVIATC
jgi:hypothetical protein